MSDLDQRLVESLGIPVAQLAIAIGKSRQAVNRGIHAKADYIKEPDLVNALAFWETADSGLYAVAKTKICELYPAVATSILEAARSNRTSSFSTDAPGDYWFICGEFAKFKAGQVACFSEIEALCGSEQAQVTLFVNARDRVPAQRLKNRFDNYAMRVIFCETDLRLFPFTLLRLDEDIDLFGVSDAGFVALSRQEAARLRDVIERTLLKESTNSKSAGVKAD